MLAVRNALLLDVVALLGRLFRDLCLCLRPGCRGALAAGNSLSLDVDAHLEHPFHDLCRLSASTSSMTSSSFSATITSTPPRGAMALRMILPQHGGVEKAMVAKPGGKRKSNFYRLLELRVFVPHCSCK